MKIWLDTVEVEWNRGFPSHEVTKVVGLVAKRQERMMEKWNEHCSQT